MTLVRNLPSQGYGGGSIVPQFEQPITLPLVQPLTPAGNIKDLIIEENLRFFFRCYVPRSSS